MESTNLHELSLPPALLAEVEAMAAVEHRSARELLREAVERYVQEYRAVAEACSKPASVPKRTPQEAATRMLERRKFHPLPEGMTIRDLMTYGRA